MAEWLRRSVSNIVASTRVGSNLVVGTIGHALITANLKFKCLIQYKNSFLPIIYHYSAIGPRVCKQMHYYSVKCSVIF